jgi:chromosome segregation ATPase
MANKLATLDERFDRLETQLSDFVVSVSKGFESTHKDIVGVRQSTSKDIDEARISNRKDIDDVLGVLDFMMTRIDDRFTKSEDNVSKLQETVGHIQNQLDSIEKQLEISEDERLVMAHQLKQLHDWVELAAKRINIKFAH